MRAQLQAERMAVSRLCDEAKRLVGHVQSLQVQLRAEHAAASRFKDTNSRDGDVENKAGKTHIIELALSARARVESRAEVGQLRDTHAWVAWMGDHLPHCMVHQHPPLIGAAMLLHTSWCMEFGDGFPFVPVRAIESTQHGRANGLPFPRLAPLKAMQFLNLSAADSGKPQSSTASF